MDFKCRKTSSAHSSASDWNVEDDGTDDADQYLRVSPEGWVTVTDLAAQSMTAWYLVNQSMPRITSMSSDLRAIREEGN